MTLLMDFTTEGATRAGQIGTNGLKFVVTHVAYGASGYNPGTPTLPLPLVPAATSLVAEVYRKFVPPGNTTLDTIQVPRGRETTYTTVGGNEFTSILGEAGIFATVTDPGTTGLPLGYQFLLAQAHFPRIVFSIYERLAIQWPLDYFVPVACIAFIPGTETNPFIGNVSILTDADVATFAGGGYDAILGDLFITEALAGDVTSLAGFAGLLYVSGNCTVTTLAVVTTLTGFDDLMLVGGNLDVSSNAALTTIAALNKLYEVTGSLSVTGNPALTTLSDAFECLNTVGGAITINGNGV